MTEKLYFIEQEERLKITLTDKGSIIVRTRGTITRKGYVRLKDAEHRDQYEHRVIQDKAGRKPKPQEDVQHKDRLRANNRPGNLGNIKHERHPLVTFGKRKK